MATSIPGYFPTYARQVSTCLRNSFNRADCADLTLAYLEIVGTAFALDQPAREAAGAIMGKVNLA